MPRRRCTEGSLAGTLLLLPLATGEPPTLHCSAAPATCSTAATTATTTPATSAASTPCPTTDPPTTSATPTTATTPRPLHPLHCRRPAATSATPAPLAPAALAPPTGSRRSPDPLSTEVVDSSSRCNGGEEGGGGAPLKEGSARVATRGTYSYIALLSCEEFLLEQVNIEVGRGEGEQVVPDSVKGFREAGD
ncbi:unnamed protein product [Closterium sp. NIES-64]|nr:unnamed protein product [Closterium sp. NIES-64]